MATNRNRTKAQPQITEVNATAPETVEAEKAQFGFVVLVSPEGQLQIENGKGLFPDQIENDLTDEVFASVIKTLNKNIEIKELVRAVKAELAR